MNPDRELPKEITDGAQDARNWYDAYIAVGFTQEEAFQLLLRPFTIVNNNAPPKRFWR